MDDVTLMHGSCLRLMPQMEAASAGAIVCDPPYGIGFLGEEWDHGVPGVPFWEAALRVALPGAHLLAFGGTRTYHRLTCAIEDAGWEIRDCLMWLYGQGMPKGKSQLKPSWEPIVMARKPLAGTMAANAAEHGCGPLNIDGCRLAMSVEDAEFIEKTARSNSRGVEHVGSVMNRPRSPTVNVHAAGRWPANAILGEDAAALLDDMAGERTSGKPHPDGHRRNADKFRNVYGAFAGQTVEPTVLYGDTGGASRFFYVPKASPSERGPGNTHPTVKPIALMRWLIRLVSPPRGLVLDPFCGSCSTALACLEEGMRFVGMDINAEYLNMGRARIAAHRASTPLFA